MLSKEENAFLSQTSPGTPMGDLFRRFWLPAFVAAEAETDGPPVRLRIMNEDLIGFRDTEGNLGIVDAYCRHKLAGLFWGRNEEGGIRCTYHGWKYDTFGNCVDMPNEPADSNFKNKIKLKSYPVREWGGLAWVYMGPADKMPELPQLEWARVPADHRHLSRWTQRTNWCQGIEGEFDNAHVGFLHAYLERHVSNDTPSFAMIGQMNFDRAPKFFVRETEYGYITASRRNTPSGEYFWSMSQWMLPTHSFVGNPGWPQSGRIWVPIDDHHVSTFSITYNAYEPLSRYVLDGIEEGRAFPPRTTQGKFTLPDGYIIDTWMPDANRENDYLIDREMQKTINFTGLWGTNEQDRSIQESMLAEPGLPQAVIVDRSKEHLGTSDVPAIALRRRMMRLARDLQKGIEPKAATNGDLYRTRSPGVRNNSISDFNELYETELQSEAIAEI